MAPVKTAAWFEAHIRAKSVCSSVGMAMRWASAVRTEDWAAIEGMKGWTETETEEEKYLTEVEKRKNWTASEGTPERTSSYSIS